MSNTIIDRNVLKSIPKLDKEYKHNPNGTIKESTVNHGDGKCTTIYHKDGGYKETIQKSDGTYESLIFDKDGDITAKEEGKIAKKTTSKVDFEC